MLITSTQFIPTSNGNGGIVPPWLQVVRDVVLPIPVPDPLKAAQGREVIGTPITEDPCVPVIM